jgi:hypothetical protein
MPVVLIRRKKEKPIFSHAFQEEVVKQAKANPSFIQAIKSFGVQDRFHVMMASLLSVAPSIGVDSAGPTTMY